MYETLAENNPARSSSPLLRGPAGLRQLRAGQHLTQTRSRTSSARPSRLPRHDARFAQISHAGLRIDNEDFAGRRRAPAKKGRHARALTVESITSSSVIAAAKRQSAGCASNSMSSIYLLSPSSTDVQPARGCVWRHHREPLPHGEHSRHPFTCGKRFPVLIKVNVDTGGGCRKCHRDMVSAAAPRKVELVGFSGVDFINLPKTATLSLSRSSACAPVPDIPSLVGGVRSLADMRRVKLASVRLARPLIDREPDFVEGARGRRTICVSCSRCFVLPHMHPGIRCVWAWKKERARQKQAAIQK